MHSEVVKIRNHTVRDRKISIGFFKPRTLCLNLIATVNIFQLIVNKYIPLTRNNNLSEDLINSNQLKSINIDEIPIFPSA